MHYVCKGCGGVSDTAKVCDTDGCIMKGQELEACDCVTPEKHKTGAGTSLGEE